MGGYLCGALSWPFPMAPAGVPLLSLATQTGSHLWQRSLGMSAGAVCKEDSEHLARVPLGSILPILDNQEKKKKKEGRHMVRHSCSARVFKERGQSDSVGVSG